jgi:hypothetical protein
MRNIKLQSMHLEYAFPLASWSYKCHGNFIIIQVCMHTYICTAIWGTIFVLHGDYLHLTSLGSWTHISISECTLKYCKSASLREKKGDFFWLSKSSFSFLSQFCIFFSFLSNPLLSIIMWCSSHTEERKQTCYAICHITENIPQLPSLLLIIGFVIWSATGEVLSFYNTIVYNSQPGRSKWTFPVIHFSLSSVEKKLQISALSVLKQLAWRRQNM